MDGTLLPLQFHEVLSKIQASSSLCRLANSDMANSLEIYLISCGDSIDFAVKNKSGHTPLEIAANSAFSPCLTLLKKHSSKTVEARRSRSNSQVKANFKIAELSDVVNAGDLYRGWQQVFGQNPQSLHRNHIQGCRLYYN